MAAQPETNRGALRDVLLDAMASNENVSVQFEADVRDIRANGAGADLLDGAGGHLGIFDLVVDAMGLHSMLRQHRVHDATDGKQPTGTTIIHGMINDPESCCGPALLGRLSRFGTVCSAGRGYTIFMQRYGAGAKDNRTSLMYYLNDVSEERLYAEMGIERPTSRATGIMKDERLDRVKEWVLRDMGNALGTTWREAVRCLDRATVRAEVTHGDTTLRDDVTLPLVCMGDSQRNAGLGGGGILAMRDALDLADVLGSNDAFDANTGSVRQPPLRMAEAAMMERKQEFHAQAVLRAKRTKESIEKHGRGEGNLADYYSGWKLGLARLLLPKLGRLTGAWYRHHEWRLGRVGSDESTIIYPKVEAVLEKGVGR